MAHLLEWYATRLRLALDDAVDPVPRDRAGRDRVHRDVVERQLDRHPERHPDLAGLGRAVADPVRKPAPAGDRRDVHDRAAARLDHLRHCEADAHVGAGEAGVDRVEPVLARVLLHALSGPAVAGVVHEGVELAEGLGPGLDHALHVGLGGGVPGDGDRPAAVGLDERGRLFHQAL